MIQAKIFLLIFFFIQETNLKENLPPRREWF